MIEIGFRFDDGLDQGLVELEFRCRFLNDFVVFVNVYVAFFPS